MTENKRYTLKEIDNFSYGIQVTDIIMDNDIELPQSTVCDLLNEQDNRIKELETVIQQILYETRANYTKEEYSATISISPQMHDKLTELITEVK